MSRRAKDCADLRVTSTCSRLAPRSGSRPTRSEFSTHRATVMEPTQKGTASGDPPRAQSPPARARGRPKKPRHETPADPRTFDAVVAAIKVVPPDERARDGNPARPGRHAARELARATALKDQRLARSAIVIFCRLLDEVRWGEGRDRGTARATLGKGLAVSAFPLSVPV